MTLDDMRRAGSFTNYLQWTDEELALTIKGTELALAYLMGKGRSWDLASNPLRSQLMQFQTYMENRKKDK